MNRRTRSLIMAALAAALPAALAAQPVAPQPPTATQPPSAATAPAAYLALVNLLAAAEPADAGSKDRVIDPEKAVQLFRASDVAGGKNFTCGVTAPPPLPPPAPAPGVRDLAAILACATNPDLALHDRLNAVNHLVAVSRTAAAQKRSRYPRAITDRSDKIRVVVMQRAVGTRGKNNGPFHIIRTTATAIEIKETARASRIVTDLQTLAKVAAKLATGARVAALTKIDPKDTEQVPVTWLSEREYVLTLNRAMLAVSAASSGPATSIAATSFSDDELKIFLQEEQDLRIAQAAANALEAQAKATAVVAKASAQIDCSTPLTLASPPLVRLSCTLLDRSTPPESRIAAAGGLGEIDQPLALGALATVASNPTEVPAVRAAAVTALAKLELPGTSATGLPAPPAAPEGSLKTTMSLNTGPVERWYLSADVPVSRKTKISTDASGAVTGVADPGAFYVGAGVQFGDLLTKHRNPLLNLSLKVMFKASSRPLDSYGLALGLRGSYLSKFGINFDVVSPFVAVLNTREVPPDSNQLPTRTTRHTSVVGGLSLNLDAALGWLK